jgi:hypothetical protein
VREREDANRTRVAGHLDEIQGVVARSLILFPNGASLLAKTFGVGFIDWLDSSPRGPGASLARPSQNQRHLHSLHVMLEECGGGGHSHGVGRGLGVTLGVGVGVGVGVGAL